MIINKKLKSIFDMKLFSEPMFMLICLPLIGMVVKVIYRVYSITFIRDVPVGVVYEEKETYNSKREAKVKTHKLAQDRFDENALVETVEIRDKDNTPLIVTTVKWESEPNYEKVFVAQPELPEN